MANIVNQYGQVKVGVRVQSSGGGGGGIDADAQAFITAASITDSTQQSAINTLVTQLKSYGIWTKLKAVYPFVGGTASAHKFNLKDPRDLDAAFRLQFNGGWTHSSTGAQPNGTTGYANTFLKPVSNGLSTTSSHLSFYGRTSSTTADGAEIANYNSSNLIGLVIQGKSGDNQNRYFYNFSNRVAQNIASAPTGLILGSSVSNTTRKLYVNNNNVATNTSTDNSTLNNWDLYIGAGNINNTSVSSYSNAQLAMASIGDGLSDTDAANFYTAVQTFQTTLGRQVGVPIVADTDAQAFLNAAVITDQTQATAINTLVTDLKSANIWTKMKAIYPFVGGTATTHKYNLKDPRDVDAAYRLVFNGGWTHSSTGALPNGTTAYADSKLKPTDMAQNSAHMATYLRTQNDNGVDMGCSTNYYFYMTAKSGASQPPAGFLNLASAPVTGTQLPTQAFYLVSRTNSTTNKLFRNTSLITNITSTSSAPEAYNIYLGAGNRNNGMWLPSPRQQAFATIGDGLTDAEAAAFYTAVQTYQTTLGRQV